MVKSLKLVKAGTESLVLAFFLCASLSSCSLLSSSEKEITELYRGFARSLQSIIANKNMNDLAELLVYPSYIGIDDGIVVNNRTEFMALDADKVFTDALIEAVKTADVSSNELTKAGFIVGDPSGKPAVTFGLDKEGSIGITGINY